MSWAGEIAQTNARGKRQPVSPELAPVSAAGAADKTGVRDGHVYSPEWERCSEGGTRRERAQGSEATGTRGGESDEGGGVGGPD